MLGDFASLDVQNTYRGSDAYEISSFCFFNVKTVAKLTYHRFNQSPRSNNPTFIFLLSLFLHVFSSRRLKVNQRMSVNFLLVCIPNKTFACNQ
nr:hypothetical protein [Piscirickettsia salmonis]